MIRTAALIALGVSTLAGQRPLDARAGVTLGIARLTHRDGATTTPDQGPGFQLVARGSRGLLAVELSYERGALGAGRTVAGGHAALDYQVHPVLRAGIAYRARADSRGASWWSMEAAGTATLPLPATPFTADVGIGLAPVGGVDDPRGFGGAWHLSAGIATRLRRHPVLVRLGYALTRFQAGSLGDTAEFVGVRAEWMF